MKNQHLQEEFIRPRALYHLSKIMFTLARKLHKFLCLERATIARPKARVYPKICCKADVAKVNIIFDKWY